MRTMERMIEKIKLNEKTPPRDNQANSQIRNRTQNFRRDTPQIKQRENDQQIRPPFQQNCADEEGEIMKPEENNVNLISSDNENEYFLTEEEKSLFSFDQTQTDCENSEDYQSGLENSIMEVHKQYDLMNKRNQEALNKHPIDTATKKTPENGPKGTSNNINSITKKTDPSKEKISQQSSDTSCPSASTSSTKNS